LAKNLGSSRRLFAIDDMSSIFSVRLDVLGWRYSPMHALHEDVACIAQRQIPRRWYDIHDGPHYSCEGIRIFSIKAISTEESGTT